jgi:hypothetical protein
MCRLGPAWQCLAVQVGQADAGAVRQRMVLREHDDLPFGQQFFGIEAGEVVLRTVQQRSVGPAVTQHGRPLPDAEGDLDKEGVGL